MKPEEVVEKLEEAPENSEEAGQRVGRWFVDSKRTKLASLIARVQASPQQDAACLVHQLRCFLMTPSNHLPN